MRFYRLIGGPNTELHCNGRSMPVSMMDVRSLTVDLILVQMYATKDSHKKTME